MTNDAPMPVTTSDILQERLKVLHDTEGLKFREIAKTPEFQPVPAGTICAIYKHGKVPRKWHKRLGLPTQQTVIVIGGGEIPPGAQVIKADQCPCGQWFISNHPRRRKCFKCSPFRKHAHSIVG